MMKMPKDEMARIEHKLYHKQRVLLRAFLINIILIFVAWLMTLSIGFMEWAAGLLSMPPALLYINMVNWLAIWDIAGVVLFLIPGLAMWWERCSIRKNM